MPVTRRTLHLQRMLTAELETMTDAQTRDLVRAWAEAWDEVEPDLTAALLEHLTAGGKVTRAQLLRSRRLLRALQHAADQLEDLADQSQVRIVGDLQQIVATAGAAQAALVDSQLPDVGNLIDLDAWSRVDTRQIDAIVQRATEQITALHVPIAPESYRIMRRELIRGVAAGINPKATAARIIRRTERVGFNGGLNRALVIARTETLDAYRAAEQLGQEQHADVLGGWQWLAKLDGRTCRSCWAQHGRRHDLTEPGPLDHHQGRCDRLPVTKSWAELGFDNIEEPESELPDAAAAFEDLSPADQRAVLGRRGYDAWLAGEYPLDGWSQRRSTDGWRDSYTPSPAPQPSGARDSSAA